MADAMAVSPKEKALIVADESFEGLSPRGVVSPSYRATFQ
jgi:hypothetical protein